jgi:DNA-binding SARP family transcriptional activator
MADKSANTLKRLDLKLLGSFEMISGNKRLDESVTRSSKTWELFSYLALNRARKIPIDEIISVFWGEGGRNPTSALKTLMHRSRSVVFEHLGENFDPVSSYRGAYSWNPDIICSIDLEDFTDTCDAAALAKSPEKRLSLYANAISLYRGHFLQRHEGSDWINELREKTRLKFIEAVFAYAELMMDAHKYEELISVMLQTAQIEPNNERLHSYIVKAQLRSGNSAEALKYYKAATDQLYRNLGIRPSEYLQEAYTEIMQAHGDMETDLSVVQTKLEEKNSADGAFFCELGFFKQAYQLESRLAERDGTCVNLALVNVSAQDGSLPPLDKLSHVMDNILDVFTPLLRKGDVISKYSGAQYIIMLPTVTVEDGEAIMQRLMTTFRSRYPRCPLTVSYDIHPTNIGL